MALTIASSKQGQGMRHTKVLARRLLWDGSVTDSLFLVAINFVGMINCPISRVYRLQLHYCRAPEVHRTTVWFLPINLFTSCLRGSLFPTPFFRRWAVPSRKLSRFIPHLSITALIHHLFTHRLLRRTSVSNHRHFEAPQALQDPLRLVRNGIDGSCLGADLV